MWTKEQHKSYMKVWGKNRWNSRRDKGLCGNCGKREQLNGLSTCENCRGLRKLAATRLKVEVLEAYGNRCTCCGEANPVFLTIDHINGGGTQHLKTAGIRATFYNWLRRNNYPQGFQLLCCNCNWGKYTIGICPHAE